MRLLGCFGLLAVLALATAEAYSFVVAHHLLGTYAKDVVGGTAWTDTILPLLVIQVVLMAIGISVVRGTIGRLPTAIMGTMMGQNADAGKLMLRLVGGILLIIPGFFLDVVGLLLLLPPIQSLLAKTGQKVVMAVVRQQMGRMFPGGMPAGGFPGGMPPGAFPGGLPKGFPGFPGAGPFPGMNPRGPLAPDERLPRRPKVVDTTAERVDRN